jgi:PilZ domain
VALLRDTDVEAHKKHIRAGVRVNSRVSVAVEWTDAGRALRAEGYTVDISPKGCLVVATEGLPVAQKVRLVNLTNQQVCDAVVIWRGNEGRGGWELGMALQNADQDFWGVVF